MPENTPIRGRGALSNPEGRFEHQTATVVDDGWCIPEEAPAPDTIVKAEAARSVITRNNSPDVPFDRSINPYRGCEHGCVYCYARPSHAYVNLSPGLDFETRLFFKQNAARLLEDELARPGYRCEPITLGANTDPYQPVEKRLRVTRRLLEVLQRFRHPVSIITKGALVERDIDILAAMAADGLASVIVSVTTLDDELKRTLEPRAAAPAARLRSIRRLTDAGIPVGVLVAPIIPAINDREIEAVVEACARAGARSAGYVLLRLPHEVAGLFREWLAGHYPQRAGHVMSLIAQMRGGKEYDATFGRRMSGTGPVADIIARRFRAACRRHGLEQRRRIKLDTSRFRVPPRPGDQMDLLGQL